MKKIIPFILALSLCFLLVGCTVSGKDEESEVEYLTVEITMDNYDEYIEFVCKDAELDENGNIIKPATVTAKSKLYDEGWVLLRFDNKTTDYSIMWAKDNHQSSLGANSHPFGIVHEVPLQLTTGKDFTIMQMRGTYTFVKKDYVAEYTFEPETRLVVLTNGDFGGCLPVGTIDYTMPF